MKTNYSQTNNNNFRSLVKNLLNRIADVLVTLVVVQIPIALTIENKDVVFSTFVGICLLGLVFNMGVPMVFRLLFKSKSVSYPSNDSTKEQSAEQPELFDSEIKQIEKNMAYFGKPDRYRF